MFKLSYKYGEISGAWRIKIKMKIKIIILSIILLFGFSQERLVAQSSHVQDRIRQMRIWKMTEELNISEDQAQKFFPKLNPYDKQMFESKRRYRETLGKLNRLINNGGSNDLIMGLIDEIIDTKKNIIKIKENFINEIREILTPQQLGKFVIFEERFEKQLQKLLQEMKWQQRRPGSRFKSRMQNMDDEF